jgi:anaerobic magnesium-protoporphyrin IX monomethyl ester cyclase
MASLLMKHNHTVRLYDRFLKAYLLDGAESTNRDMKSEILRFKPDIIGFSTISSIIYDTVECVKFVRDFYDGSIVAGGHHATAMPEITLQKIPGLDYAAAGESEYTMLSLADGKDPSGIPGLFSKYTDTDSFSRSHIKDLDDLPFPEYTLFDMDHYTQANRNTLRGFYLRAASILTSRGCLNNCKFCAESLSYGKGVRFHSADYVIENIKKLVYDYKIEGLYFNDNDFLSSYSHAENICKKIIDHNLHKKIKWAIQAGTPRVNNDILGLLSKAGCVKIEFGIESIKDRDLKSINKHATMASNEKALSLCREHGIRAHAYFMTGFKGENISDLNNTLSWIHKHKPHTFSLHQIKVYPGTALYKESGDNFFENNVWTRSTIENYFKNEKFSTISREKRRTWYVKVYRPFQSKYHTKALLTANSLRTLLRIVRKKYLK